MTWKTISKLAIDVFALRGKDVNILVVTDHFTWYAQTFVTPSQTA